MVEPHPLLFLVPNNMVVPVPWDRPFTEPIELPKGKKLVTLRDAALNITELPKAEHDAPTFIPSIIVHLTRQARERVEAARSAFQ